MKHDAWTLPLLLALAPACHAAAPQQSVALERPATSQLVARARAAIGRRAQPLTLAGRSRDQGIEADASFTFAPGGAFVRRVDGPLASAVGNDGETVWRTDYDGSTRALRLQGRDEERFEHWFQSGYWVDPRAPIAFEDDPGEDAGAWLVVRIADTPTEGRLRLDPESALPAALVQATPAGERTWTFSDWRDHDGLRVAHEVQLVDEAGHESWSRWSAASVPPTFVRSPFAPPLGGTNDATFDPDAPAELETLRVASGHVLVHPLVEGEDVGWFILDTGAGAMCIDGAAARELDLPSVGQVLALGVGGHASTSFRRGTRFELGPMRLESPVYVELDLAFLSDIFGEEIGGIVGYDLFARAVVELEARSARAWIHDPARYELTGARWQTMALDSRTPAVEGSFEGDHTAFFRLDTGAGSGTVTFHAPTVERLRLLEGRAVKASKAGGVGGTVDTWTGPLEWFELGGRRFERPTVGFSVAERGGLADRYTAGNLGQAFLKPFRMVLDYPHDRIAFVPLDGASDG